MIRTERGDLVRGGYTIITEQMVDGVFAKGSPIRARFDRPTLAENICRRRAKGEAITDISKRYGYSTASCANIIRKAIRLYTMTEVE